MNLGDQSATRAADCLISVFWCAGGMQVISQYGAVDADLLEVGIHLRFIAVLAPKCAWPFTADHGRPPLRRSARRPQGEKPAGMRFTKNDC